MHRKSWVPVVALLCASVGACSPEAATRESREASPAPPAASASRSATASPSEPQPPRLPRELARALGDNPVEARSASQVVDQIVAAERAIADPGPGRRSSPPRDTSSRWPTASSATRPGWDDRVRAALPGDLVRVVRDNVASRRAFRSMHPQATSDLATSCPPGGSCGRRRLARCGGVRRGRGPLRRGLELSGGDQPRRDRPRPDPGHVGGRRPGADAVHPEHLGDLRPGRHQLGPATRSSPRAGSSDQGFTRPGGRAEALYRYNNSTAYVRGVTLLAEVMERRPRAFLGYYHWQIYYLTTRAASCCPRATAATEPIPVTRWLARHP